MGLYRIEIAPLQSRMHPTTSDPLADLLRDAGLSDLKGVTASRLFFLEGPLERAAAQRVAEHLLRDPVTEQATLSAPDEPVPAPASGSVAVEVHLHPGVMDPVAESTLAELRAGNVPVTSVRTARRYVLRGALKEAAVELAARRVLANECIEHVILGTAGVTPAPQPRRYTLQRRTVTLRRLDDAALAELSRTGHLFLSLDEMRTIQAHFRTLEREPTDLELETIAQTWSEHCGHKTLKSAVRYIGAPIPRPGEAASAAAGESETRQYGNLLKDTIAKATASLMAAGRGPECLSVFKDNAGVIAFDDAYGVAFKVETHNHPSAIEPYGGAATGIGGVIRDVIGCGLAAKPIASTDVFCVAPSDWPQDGLPKGVLHPWRVLRGIAAGVADYGNRMGIPTVNGAVYFDPRYLGNPLVFAGSVGLIPRNRLEKAARPGDLVVVIGGRTGRDGIHGATFSSAELTDTHADEFSHAVQIGNAITEKRFLDAVLLARDAPEGCLFSAITDCGAGGLSSAVGEMAEEVGAVVDLERVPLKYPGLRYDEIWISEAQERMVLAVPPEKLPRVLAIMEAEEVEATVIGTFGADGAKGPRLVVRYDGQVVGDLDLKFLHHGLPQPERSATWQPAATAAAVLNRPAATPSGQEVMERLSLILSTPNVAAKTWIIRSYDHEVQGRSVIKPLVGPGRGPSDAAVLRPRLDSRRGIALGCGLAPWLSDLDPYWMAAAVVDEAIRNVVCVGGDARRTAILDNFCWGRTDDPGQLGALVRACQACHDAALAYGTPFISGKDSLNNEFALDPADVAGLLNLLRQRATRPGPESEHLAAVLADIAARVQKTGRLAIPQTLLISALSLVDDVGRCVTPDLKHAGDPVLLVGGWQPAGFDLRATAVVHTAVATLIASGAIVACHDVSDGGWLVTLAEMALAGMKGARVAANAALPDAFAPLVAAYLVEAGDAATVRAQLRTMGICVHEVAEVRADATFDYGGAALPVEKLAAAWTQA